jgi:hypothetical protein
MSLKQSPWDQWSARAMDAPLPLRPAWMAAERGRIGRDPHVLTAGSAAAHVLLVEPHEPRIGYTVSDIVGSRDMPVPGLPSGPTAFVGALGARLPGVVWAEGPALTNDLAALVTQVECWASSYGAIGVAVGPLPREPEWTALASALMGAGFQPVTQLPEAILHIDDTGMDGVLARLSRNQCKNVRRQRDVFHRSGGRVDISPVERVDQPETARLLRDHYRKFGHRASLTEAADRLRRAAALPGATALAVVDEDGLRGFSVLAVDPSRRELFSRIGACPRDNVFSYFNLVFYARVDEAAKRGVRTLYYGDETYAPKVQRGCVLRRLTMYVHFLGWEPPDLGQRCAARSRAAIEAVRAELPRGYDYLLEDGGPGV